MVRGMPLPISAQQPEPHRTLTPALLGVMWIVLFGFGTFFLNYSTLVITGERMGLSAVTAGTVLTVMMVAVVVIQPAVPVCNIRLGPRITFALALALQAVGHLLSLIAAYPFAAVLTGSVVGGLGFGILVVLGTAVVPSTVAPDRLGRALGYFGAATASATAIGAPVGLWLITFMTATDFRWLSFGFVMLALPAIFWVPKKEVSGTAGPHSTTQQHASPVRGLRIAGLVIVLLPAALIMTVFGLVLAFGPASDTGSPAFYLATMQVFVIAGRFLGSAPLDRFAAQPVMLIGLTIAVIGLLFSALLPAGWSLLLAMAVLGIGTGTVQASSLLLAFQQAGSTNRGSVAWNMTFDIGLAFAGLVGGFGFTYWGAELTYGICAAALFIASLIFAWYFRPHRQAH